MSMTPFPGEYIYFPTSEMLMYRQPLTADTVGNGESVCCGRLCGTATAYRYKGGLYIEVAVTDSDDMDHYCSVKVDDENTQRELFRETVNVLKDLRFYKVDCAWDFFRNVLLNIVDKIFLEKGAF